MGKGCPGCGRWSLLNTKIFIERSIEKHGKKFDYSQVEYINARTKVKIICPKHGVFEQTPQSHLSGNGCPTCLESKGEKKISLFLDSNKIKFIREKSFEKCRDKNPLLFDFFLPDFNTCIEFDGKQHYQPIAYFGGEAVFEKTKKSDAIKANFCKKEGISLIRISSYKGHDIESVLKNLLIL
jgi:very-short-patch-repair endonuclease